MCLKIYVSEDPFKLKKNNHLVFTDLHVTKASVPKSKAVLYLDSACNRLFGVGNKPDYVLLYIIFYY